MGRLIKNHLARLITLGAASYHLGASFTSFFWPKIFFDFLTTNLNPLIKPYPILQPINLLLALLVLSLEYPLPFIPAHFPAIHSSFELRLFGYPLVALLAVLLYQGTDCALWYLAAVGVWFWAFCDGEVVMGVPWTLPRRVDRERGRKMPP